MMLTVTRTFPRGKDNMTNPDKTIMAHLAAAHAIADDQRLMREEHFGGSGCKDNPDWMYYAYLGQDIEKTLTDIPQAERQQLAEAMATVIKFASDVCQPREVGYPIDEALQVIGATE